MIPTATDRGDITFYWLYAGQKLNVRYHYCVRLIADEECSPDATAVYNVNGVQGPGMIVFNEDLARIALFDGCSSRSISRGPQLVYGNLSGPAPGCGDGPTISGPKGVPGIKFTHVGLPPDAGNFLFVQLINADSTQDLKAGFTTTCITNPGIDRDYPYQIINPMSVDDAPGSPLPSTFTEVIRNFSATMYLLCVVFQIIWLASVLIIWHSQVWSCLSGLPDDQILAGCLDNIHR